MDKCLGYAVLFVLCITVVSTQVTFEAGDGYLGRAFDIARGSSHPINIQDLATSYSKANIYKITARKDFISYPFPAQELTVETYNISKVSDVARQIGFNISIGLTISPQWGFQGSAIYQSINNKYSAGSIYSYVSNAGVSKKFLRLDAGLLSPAFVADVADLPTTYVGNEASFIRFINRWGTHYIASVTVGGRNVFSISMNQTIYQSLASNYIDVYLGLQIQAYGSFSVGFTSSDRNFQAVENLGLKQSKFTFGGQTNLADQDFNAWSTSLDTAPMPIFFDLETYTFLVADLTKRDALRQALVTYVNSTVIYDPSLAKTPAYQELLAYFTKQPTYPLRTYTDATNTQSESEEGNEQSPASSTVLPIVLMALFVLLL